MMEVDRGYGGGQEELQRFIGKLMPHEALDEAEAGGGSRLWGQPHPYELAGRQEELQHPIGFSQKP